QFVPRVLRLKGAHEPRNAPRKLFSEPATADQGPAVASSLLGNEQLQANKNSLLETKPTSDENQKASDSTKVRGPKFTVAPVTDEYLAQLVCGIELLFTDYAIQSVKGSKWLESRYWSDDETGKEDKYIHISDFVEHPYVDRLRPRPTQDLIRRALQENPSEYLETAKDGSLVRRKPSTFPAKFIPKVILKDGIDFWDERTIYIEPHDLILIKCLAKLAWWLKTQVLLGQKWLPIQNIRPMYKRCAFVVVSRNVRHDYVWREVKMPDSWKVMSWVEHQKRTDEYLELLAKE
ncbi:uncharacterized protein BDR25DRAFT_180279, partial [Lindgomyces ingoldianus]